jgi:hypothetical protein
LFSIFVTVTTRQLLFHVKDDTNKGAQLIVGKGAAALELRNCREAECQTKMPIRRVQLECGVGEG